MTMIKNSGKGGLNLDLGRVKAGMIAAFDSDGSFVARMIERCQLDMGFGAAAARKSHVAVCVGGPYLIDCTYPRVRPSSLLHDYQGRVVTFLFHKDAAFRTSERFNFALMAARDYRRPYGWPGLLGFYVRLALPLWAGNPLESYRAPFCSSHVARALRAVGFDPWPGVASGLVTPAHVAAAVDFEAVDCSR